MTLSYATKEHKYIISELHGNDKLRKSHWKNAMN